MLQKFLPWSHGYLIENAGHQLNGKATKMGNGCWSSMAPDNSYIWFHLTCCPHKDIQVFKGEQKIGGIDFNIKDLPKGTLKDEFYHPKFASHGARYMVVTGGYFGNSGSKEAEVYLGRFSANYKKFEAWFRID